MTYFREKVKSHETHPVRGDPKNISFSCPNVKFDCRLTYHKTRFKDVLV